MKNYFNDLQSAKDAGFKGFVSIRELNANPNVIPNVKGVYMVVRKNTTPPNFLKEGTGGFFKDKDPNVSTDELQNNWVDETQVVYIGKAGAVGSSATLNSRLKQYLKFGQGRNIGHYGGRYIWQLVDSQDLLLCWKTMPQNDIDPRNEESQMIAEFKSMYNKRPFANLQG